MKVSIRVKLFLFRIEDFFSRIKGKIWNKRLRLWWFRLWIREDEFDSSLSMDEEAMFDMDNQEEEVYRKDLIRRRYIAHQRDLE